MKYSVPFAIVVLALGLSACEFPGSQPTTVIVPSSVPGPAGPAGATGSTGSTGYTGAQGATGDTGEKGKKGDGATVVIVPQE